MAGDDYFPFMAVAPPLKCARLNDHDWDRL
jgi:hypothetical protein